MFTTETKSIIISNTRIFTFYFIFCLLGSKLYAQISLEDMIYTQFDYRFDSIKYKIEQSFDYNYKTRHKNFLEISSGNKLNAKKITVLNSLLSTIEYTFLVNKLTNVELNYKFSTNDPEKFESWYNKLMLYIESYVKFTSSSGNLNMDTIKKMLTEDCVIINKDLNSRKNSFGEKVWYLDSTIYHDRKKLTLNAYFLKNKISENGNDVAECYYFLKFNLNNNRSTDIYAKYPEYSTIIYRSASTTNEILLSKINGVFYIPGIIDSSIKLDFIFDTGAADVSLTPDVVLTLIRAGLITERDFIGNQTYQFADGTIAKSKIFILKNLKIGNKTIYNIKASLSESIDAPLLLGQSAISKLGPFSIDLKAGVLKIEN